jgi:hypothetical protein
VTALSVLLGVAASDTGQARGTTPVVDTFPIPGGHVAAPQTQITFRGLPASQLGPITVTGSRSGVHPGQVFGDSDGLGGSFIPAKPFTPGELVTVTTGLDIAGGSGGSFQFTVADPGPALPAVHWPHAGRKPGDVERFYSQPGLAPPTVKILKRSPQADGGDIFLTPQFGPAQDGLEIVNQAGGLVWWRPLSGDTSAADLRVQQYEGRPVLTWWQGYVSDGLGIGEGVIDNTNYQPVATVHAGNGLSADLHEFQITPWNTALITSYYPVYWDTRSVHGGQHRLVFDAVVQEVDIPTGLVLFQWDSLDHVPLSDSYEALPRQKSIPFDFIHINSVGADTDGNLLISGRNTWAVYKVNHQTGAIIWTLGGKRSSFKMGGAAQFAFQHDARVLAPGDQYITVFDDGSGPPRVHSQSRGLVLMLNFTNMTAAVAGQREHTPALLSTYEGNFQSLPDRDDFVGWGMQPYFTEFDPAGHLILDGRFVGSNSSYRAYKFPWHGMPATGRRPRVAALRSGRRETVYASWNGATAVSAWRVLGGSSATGLRWAAAARKRGFETRITLRRAPSYVAVQAVDGHDQTLATSATVRAH